ncbi:MAG: glycosyltransferase family protein [Sulfuricella sp.]
MPHLLVDLSYHGFGHIAQTAPVINALAERLPSLRVTLRSGAPQALLAQRFHCDFTLISKALDFGMEMADALAVRVEESAEAYRDFHRDWKGRVALEAENMAALAPDLLFANVPYLSLAAAACAGIPAVGMCSLNWADIYAHYRPEAPEIHSQILDAYNSAACFLRPLPAMPMDNLTNSRAIGPNARLGRNRRAEMEARLGISPGDRLVLIAMGGIAFRLALDSWPRIPGVRWVVLSSWQVHHPDAVELESLEMDFTDVLASCDALLTKPGYGSFAEAACHGVPVLYLDRKDWPEALYLVEWLKRQGRCMEVERAALERGAIAAQLEALWALPPTVPVEPEGIAQAADLLQDLLD